MYQTTLAKHSIITKQFLSKQSVIILMIF